MTMAIEIKSATLRYEADADPALEIDRLIVPQGQCVAILGTSGSGKTSLLRLVNGLVAPTSGTVSVLGVDLESSDARTREFRRLTGHVFQEFNLVERATVLRNVLCGRLGWMGTIPSLLGLYSDTDVALAGTAIAETGLSDLAERRADSLSGGQRQRVAIARALAQNPDLLTADEPVSNLDPVLADEILGLLLNAGRRRGATTLAVVHHPTLIEGRVDRTIGLADGLIVYDSDDGEPLDGRALRRIYGRSLPPIALNEPDDDTISPIHVA